MYSPCPKYSYQQLPPVTRDLQATVRTQILLTLSLQKREPTLRLLLRHLLMSNVLYDQPKFSIILMKRKKGWSTCYCLYCFNWPAQGVHGKRPLRLRYLCTDFYSGNSGFRRNNLFGFLVLALLMMLLTCSMFAQINVRSFCGDQYPIDMFCAAYG